MLVVVVEGDADVDDGSVLALVSSTVVFSVGGDVVVFAIAKLRVSAEQSTIVLTLLIIGVYNPYLLRH